MEELRESECMWEGGRGRMEGRKRSKEQGGMRKEGGRRRRMEKEGKGEGGWGGRGRRKGGTKKR